MLISETLRLQSFCTLAMKVIFSLLLFGLMRTAHAECLAREGQRIILSTPSEILKTLSEATIVKNEFETTRDYEERRGKAIIKLGMSSLAVESPVDRTQILYDADKQRFQVRRTAWDAGTAILMTVLTVGNSYGAGEVGLFDEVHGIGFPANEHTSGEYSATNNFGVPVEVSKIEKTEFLLFDRNRRPRERTWEYDFGGDEKGGEIPGILLNAPREIAPKLKLDLRIAVEFRPRSPFLIRKFRRERPTIESPRDVAEDIEIFVGRLGCVLLTDSEGLVIRTLPTAYQN